MGVPGGVGRAHGLRGGRARPPRAPQRVVLGCAAGRGMVRLFPSAVLLQCKLAKMPCLFIVEFPVPQMTPKTRQQARGCALCPARPGRRPFMRRCGAGEEPRVVIIPGSWEQRGTDFRRALQGEVPFSRCAAGRPAFNSWRMRLLDRASWWGLLRSVCIARWRAWASQ